MKTVYVISSEIRYYRTEVKVPDDATEDEIIDQFHKHGIGDHDEFDQSDWQVDKIETPVPADA